MSVSKMPQYKRNTLFFSQQCLNFPPKFDLAVPMPDYIRCFLLVWELLTFLYCVYMFNFQSVITYQVYIFKKDAMLKHFEWKQQHQVKLPFP